MPFWEGWWWDHRSIDPVWFTEKWQKDPDHSTVFCFFCWDRFIVLASGVSFSFFFGFVLIKLMYKSGWKTFLKNVEISNLRRELLLQQESVLHLAEDAVGCLCGGASPGEGMLQLQPEKRQHPHGEMRSEGVHPHHNLWRAVLLPGEEGFKQSELFMITNCM